MKNIYRDSDFEKLIGLINRARMLSDIARTATASMLAICAAVLFNHLTINSFSSAGRELGTVIISISIAITAQYFINRLLDTEAS